RGSMHANSWRDPLFQSAAKLASEETKGLSDNFCFGCHVPVGVISGEIPPIDGSKLSPVAASGVSCDFCHTVSKTRGVGNLPATSEPGNVKWGPFTDSKSPFHDVQFSDTHTSARFCGLCHNMSHPMNGLQIVGTYTEWLTGPYRAAGVTCQDCHMTPPDPPTAFTPNPGVAALNGPKREHRWTHQFVGGNVMVAELLGAQLQADYARKRLEAAAEVEILPPATVSRPGLLEFAVKVRNVGAGHYLPTGMTEMRQMWLDVRVVDANGTEIYSSGAVDDAGEIEPNAAIFRTVLGDESGNPTWRMWEATHILYDHRIPPKGYRVERYAAYVPPDTGLPLTVRATLRYRSVSPQLAKELLADEAPPIPVIDMRQAAITVE
ncbi:MAG: multiheme c-type cytochrome, partial [Thermoanaerobaculia bacterium]